MQIYIRKAKILSKEKREENSLGILKIKKKSMKLVVKTLILINVLVLTIFPCFPLLTLYLY